MVNGSNLSRKIDAYNPRAQYDAEAKKVLADKLLLSYILAYTVEEYAGMNPADIIELIEDVKVSEVSIEPGETNNPDIKGDNNEDKVPYEGSVYFDVRFHVWKPDKSERIKMIIDVEAQRKFRPGYDLISKGVFYTSRLISAQRGTEFVKEKYDDLKKVYTIFICFNAPAYAENTITEFVMKQKNILGNMPPNKFRMDIPNIVLVCLSRKLVEEKDEFKLHRLLETVFSETMKPAEKKELIETEYDIDMSEDLERRIENMFDFSESIWERGVDEGKEIGRSEGRAEGMSLGMSELLLNTLATLGNVPEILRDRIMAENDPAVLTNWNRLLGKSNSVEEFEKAIG